MDSVFNEIVKVEPSKLQKWSTKNVDKLKDMMDDGYIPKSTPFHDNKMEWKKGNIVFEYTPKEANEIYKCASDIIYFANNYCHVKTREGIKNIKLRDYQERVLKAYQDNSYIVFLSCRQSGKCLEANTTVNLIDRKETLSNLYVKYSKNLNFLQKIKFKLYKFLFFLNI